MGSISGVILFLALLALGVHVATVMWVMGIGVAFLSLGNAIVFDFGNQVWAALNNFVLTAVPLFILMGEFLLRSGITDKMYKSLSLLLSRLPGRLLHTNIAACAILAANSGSSVATAAMVGTVAIPTLKEKGYNDRIVLGSLAAGGTLGILIPPSISMIIYGSIADASVGRLFMGGFIPGILLASFFSMVIIIIATVRPNIAGIPEPKVSFKYKLRALISLIPPLILIFVIMGSIYLGWATPTEAAALGTVTVFILAAIEGRVSIRMLHESFKATVRTTSLILLIITAAFYMNYVIALLGLPQIISRWFVSLKVTPIMTMYMIVVFYLILGCFIETVAMIVTTIPLVVPLVVGAGYDPIWFGVFLTVLCEASLITPPVGMNIYVIQGIRIDKGPFKDVCIGIIPFLGMMIILLILLIHFPSLALWLPNQMFGP